MRQASLDVAVPDTTVRVAFTDWGEPTSARVVVCVHGLSRQGRDFDALAAALAPSARVICPDMPGRGASGWLANPELYATPTYLTVIKALLEHVGAARVTWIGTSMGGLLGMLSAAAPDTTIDRLVINDIGPLIPASAARRIGSYLGGDPLFPDLGALEAHMRKVHAPFGPLDDAHWRHLARYSARADGQGFRLHYDPAIAHMFAKLGDKDTELWPLWDAIRCPTLVLRGAESDLLSAETATAMTLRGPKATLVTWPGIGHAPVLMAPDQIAMVRDFVLA